MATIAHVKDGLTHLGGQLAAGTVVTAELLGSILTQLVVFADVVSRLENSQHTLTTQVAVEVGSLREKATQQQGALEVLASRPGGGDRPHHTRSILESKAVCNLSSLGSDKTMYRLWNERLINVVAAVRFGSRRLFKRP